MLVGAFVLAYNKVGWFRDFVNATFRTVSLVVTTTFHAITTVIGDVITWVRGHWQLVLGILTGPFGLAIAWIATHMDTVKTIFHNIVGAIGTALSTVGQVISAPFKLGFDLIAMLWNDTLGGISFTLPSWIPGLGGKGFSFPKMPVLDSGGIVTGPTIAMLSKNSKPEAIIPLDRLPKQSGPSVLVQVQGFVGNEQQLAAAIVNAINRAAQSGVKHTLNIAVGTG